MNTPNPQQISDDILGEAPQLNALTIGRDFFSSVIPHLLQESAARLGRSVSDSVLQEVVAWIQEREEADILHYSGGGPLLALVEEFEALDGIVSIPPPWYISACRVLNKLGSLDEAPTLTRSTLLGIQMALQLHAEVYAMPQVDPDQQTHVSAQSLVGSTLLSTIAGYCSRYEDMNLHSISKYDRRNPENYDQRIGAIAAVRNHVLNAFDMTLIDGNVAFGDLDDLDLLEAQGFFTEE